jgi:uncharacterized protein YggU (UPF0235/DUF167 family)
VIAKLTVREPTDPEILNRKPWVQLADGVALDVRLTPRSARDAIEGAANAALCRLVAHELGIAPRQVEIAAGEGGASSGCASPAIRECSRPCWTG